MNASGGLYPSLGRYFKSLTDLANAGCMSRQRARDCLDGKKEFTEAEKKAIAANISMRIHLNVTACYTCLDLMDLTDAATAWNGHFDEIYRKKVKNV